MGRGKVPLKRIENKVNRQVTFSKRRTGLLKKAFEISVLCDAEVAVILFSAAGKLYEFATDSRMDKILERYERYSYYEKALMSAESESEGNWRYECSKLKAKIEAIQKYHKHLMGEDLESLNPKELEQLERQLERSLKHIRSRKSHLTDESISELKKKERSLQEKNKALQKELAEWQKAAASSQQQLQVQWDQQTQTQVQTSSSSSSFMMRQDQQGLPPPQNICLPLTIGERGEEVAAAVQQQQPPPGQAQQQAQVRVAGLPPWMLSHLKA